MKYQITSKSVYYVYTFLKPKTVLVKSTVIPNIQQISTVIVKLFSDRESWSVPNEHF